MAEFEEPLDVIDAKSLVDKINKIDEIEKRQSENVYKLNKVVVEVNDIQKHLKDNQLDGRLTKVEKRQEFVLENIQEINKDIRMLDEKCDKQRSACMGSVAPLTLVSGLKEDIHRMVLRFEAAIDAMSNNFRITMKEASDTHGRWSRWSLTMSLVATLIAAVALIAVMLPKIPLPIK
jgi:hypothetical protein